ncbi:MAG: hypothetical protein Tsb0020_17150 [Haliangiales bacterium]
MPTLYSKSPPTRRPLDDALPRLSPALPALPSPRDLGARVADLRYTRRGAA